MIVKGYRGSLALEEIKALAARGIYVFNFKCVAGKEHLIYAYQKARRAFEKGNNIARDIHIEIMLILTGRRQIREALSLASAEKSEAFVAISEQPFELPYPEDDGLVSCSIDKLEYLGIEWNAREDTPCELAFENSALLELQR